MIQTVLYTAFILLVGFAICYMIATYVVNAMAKNVLLAAAVIITGLVLLRFFRLI